MATSFSVNTADGAAVANSLQGEDEAILSYIQSIITLAESMAQTWIGQTPQAYQQAQAQWNEGIGKMRDGMTRAIEVLRSNLQSYHNTDESLTGLFSGFHL
jgi:WXG100 family type VII secretion target